MKINKRAGVLLAGTLLVTVSIFTTGTYMSKQKDTYNLNVSTLNSEVIVEETKEIALSIQAAEEISKNIEENKVQVAIEAQQAENKVDMPVVNRGGSGLAKPKTESKVQIKPVSKPVVKAQTKKTTTTLIKSSTSATSAAEERDLFARLVSAEAEGESFEGQLAVATVIMNRVKSPDYPNTIRGVIMDKAWGYQFTPVSDGRINLPASESAKKAVDMVLRGHRSFDSKVLFFLNPSKSVSSYIQNNRTYYKTIGKHEFYY
jgi:N-acetylmuramoyl-L-alanine amidase